MVISPFRCLLAGGTAMLPQILLDCSRHNLALRLASADGHCLKLDQSGDVQCHCLLGDLRFGCHPFGHSSSLERVRQRNLIEFHVDRLRRRDLADAVFLLRICVRGGDRGEYLEGSSRFCRHRARTTTRRRIA